MTSSPDEHKDDHLWKRPAFPNHAESIRGFGGVAAPLLAGFSLAAISTQLTTSTELPMRDAAIAGFSIAIVCLLFTIQYTFLAVGYWTKPSELLDWTPEANSTYEALAWERYRQRLFLHLFGANQRIAGLCYETGIAAFLGSVVLLLVPEAGDWTVGRIIAVAVASAGFLLELIWISGSWFKGLTRPLLIPAARKKQLRAVARPAPPAPASVDGFAKSKEVAETIKAGLPPD